MNHIQINRRFVFIVLALVLLLGLISPVLPAQAGSGVLSLLKTIFPGDNSYPSGGYTYRGVMFFTARDSMWNRGLWRTDGTTEGTLPEIDTNPGKADTSPNASFASEEAIQMVGVGDYIYFLAYDGTKMGIWQTHVKNAETKLVANFPTNAVLCNSGDNYSAPRYVNGSIFMIINDHVHGCEVWKYKPGDAEPKMLPETSPGDSGVFSIMGLGIAGKRVIYSGFVNDGVKFWATDGSTVENILTVNNCGFTCGASTFNEVVSLGDRFYFYVRNSDNPTYGQGLYMTDGTKAGTKMVPNSSKYTIHLVTSLGNRVYFTTYEDSGLYKIPSVGASAEFVAQVPSPVKVQAFKEKLFFVLSSRSLYVSDGTAAGTGPFQFASQTSVVRYTVYDDLGVMEGRLYFIAKAPNAVHDWELWSSNGTTDGTRLEVKIDSPDLVRILGNVGNHLILTIPKSNGRQPWVYSVKYHKNYLPALIK